MANSLMELYGGGMVGNRTNYQLGGRVAASRRGREYAGEIRRLNEAAERAQRRQSRASSLGNILGTCLLYTSPSPRDLSTSRMPSSA